MKCPRCGREIKLGQKFCRYCRTPLDRPFSKTRTRVIVKGEVDPDAQTHVETVKMRDLPESIQKQITGSTPADIDDVVVIKRTVTDSSIVAGREETAGPTEFVFEKEIPILEKMKRLYESGEIEYPLYSRLVLEKVENYLSTLGPRDRVIFAVKRIQTSDFADYIDDHILKEIRALVLRS